MFSEFDSRQSFLSPSYHITEVPIFISGGRICTSDPQQKYLYNKWKSPSFKSDGFSLAIPSKACTDHPNIMALFGAYEDSGVLVCFYLIVSSRLIIIRKLSHTTVPYFDFV